ncbi:MAG TPA: peptidoglycan DD-metalloendopeptidase family protein [Candidatus Acidoferrum sp.]|nr:peptidoglycan DD-metalloendopeptidase family protein [Candidatus Acidoferrum sp.]
MYMTGLVVLSFFERISESAGYAVRWTKEFIYYCRWRFSKKEQDPPPRIEEVGEHPPLLLGAGAVAVRIERKVTSSVCSFLTGLPTEEIIFPAGEEQRHHYLRAFASRCFTVFVPGACVLLVAAVLYSAKDYALGVKAYIDGEQVAVLASEEEYDAVADRVEKYISSITGESYTISAQPTYQMVLVKKDDLGVYEKLEEALLRRAEDVVAQSCGLYVDGQLVAVNSDKEQLEEMLAALLESYRASDSEVERIEFVQDVRVEEGLLPRKLEKSVYDIQALLTSTTVQEQVYSVQKGDIMGTIAPRFEMTVSQLKALNPDVDERKLREGMQLTISKPVSYITVKSVRTVIFEESIPYQNQVVSDDSMYTYERKITQSGRQGTAEVTAEVCTIDGLEISRLELDRTTVAEPVTQIEKRGTKTPPPKSPTGTFRSPVTGATVTSRFGSRRSGYHTGIDLAVPTGTTIVAADGGVVTFAGWSGSYGKLIKVSHSNGYSTWYAHCSAILVSVGQQVGKGEPIGRVGSTGNSTGPHLHFEVRINGSAVNPAGYIGK